MLFGYGVWSWLLVCYLVGCIVFMVLLVLVFGMGFVVVLLVELLLVWKFVVVILVLVGLVINLFGLRLL